MLIFTNLCFFSVPPRIEIVDPCNPSPCGSNAVCNNRQRAAACQCIPEYFGDPYVACRPECVVNSDCPSNKACQRNKCIDPCPGTCGINALCQVRSHIPTCTCIEGYIGDPFTECRLKPLGKFLCILWHVSMLLHLSMTVHLMFSQLYFRIICMGIIIFYFESARLENVGFCLYILHDTVDYT